MFCYRFRVRVPLEEQRAQLKYSVRFAGSAKTPSGMVHLPAEHEDWHVAAYSCNDQRQHPKVGIAAWTRMRQLQKRNPIHVLLGTGDQVCALLTAPTPQSDGIRYPLFEVEAQFHRISLECAASPGLHFQRFRGTPMAHHAPQRALSNHCRT